MNMPEQFEKYEDLDHNSKGKFSEHQLSKLESIDNPRLAFVEGKVNKTSSLSIQIKGIQFTVSSEQQKILHDSILYRVYYLKMKRNNKILSVLPYADLLD